MTMQPEDARCPMCGRPMVFTPPPWEGSTVVSWACIYEHCGVGFVYGMARPTEDGQITLQQGYEDLARLVNVDVGKQFKSPLERIVQELGVRFTDTGREMQDEAIRRVEEVRERIQQEEEEIDGR